MDPIWPHGLVVLPGSVQGKQWGCVFTPGAVDSRWTGRPCKGKQTGACMPLVHCLHNSGVSLTLNTVGPIPSIQFITASMLAHDGGALYKLPPCGTNFIWILGCLVIVHITINRLEHSSFPQVLETFLHGGRLAWLMYSTFLEGMDTFPSRLTWDISRC